MQIIRLQDFRRMKDKLIINLASKKQSYSDSVDGSKKLIIRFQKILMKLAISLPILGLK